MYSTIKNKLKATIIYILFSACTAVFIGRVSLPAVLAQDSVGYGWPVPIMLGDYDGYPEEQFVGSVTPWYWEENATARSGDVPENIIPLETDLFTSNDFYADRESGWIRITTGAIVQSRLTQFKVITHPVPAPSIIIIPPPLPGGIASATILGKL